MAKLAAKSSKPRRWRIENGLVCHALTVALLNIPKDGDGKAVQKEWVELLERDAVRPLEDLKNMEIQSCAREMCNLTTDLFKQCSAVNNYKELALAVCLLINKLVGDNRVDDAGSQGVLISNAILLENADHQDWGDSKLAKRGSEQMYDFLLRENYFSVKTIFIK